jgi:hypothetical protein
MAHKASVVASATLLLTLSLGTPGLRAQSPPSVGERLFVEGTEIFRATGSARDIRKGIDKLLASADHGYHFAPYGLCIAFSVEPEILNLVESYAWCKVAARKRNRVAERAESRATEVLGRIAVHEGVGSVSLAKQKAGEYERKYVTEP